MRIRSHTAVLAAGLAGGMLCAGAAWAAPHIVPGTAAHAWQPVRTASSAYKLASVTIDQGDPDVSVAGGFTAIDSATVKCAKPTCTIAIDMVEEAGGQSTASNFWGVCAVVDGAYAANGCPYAGELPADGSFTSTTARQTFAVTTGMHTVGFELFTEATAVAGIFDVQYQV